MLFTSRLGSSSANYRALTALSLCGTPKLKQSNRTAGISTLFGVTVVLATPQANFYDLGLALVAILTISLSSPLG